MTADWINHHSNHSLCLSSQGWCHGGVAHGCLVLHPSLINIAHPFHPQVQTYQHQSCQKARSTSARADQHRAVRWLQETGSRWPKHLSRNPKPPNPESPYQLRATPEKAESLRRRAARGETRTRRPRRRWCRAPVPLPPPHTAMRLVEKSSTDAGTNPGDSTQAPLRWPQPSSRAQPHPLLCLTVLKTVDRPSPHLQTSLRRQALERR